MKLYSDLQISQSLRHYNIPDSEIHKIISFMEPIELPSDDEIEVERKRYGVHGVLFSDGAKWVKEQILPDDISKYKLESEQILNQNK